MFSMLVGWLRRQRRRGGGGGQRDRAVALDRAEMAGDDAAQREPPHRVGPVRPAGIDPDPPGQARGARPAGDDIDLARHVGGAAAGADVGRDVAGGAGDQHAAEGERRQPGRRRRAADRGRPTGSAAAPAYSASSRSFQAARCSCQMPSAIIAATAPATMIVGRSGSRLIPRPRSGPRARGADIRARAAAPWRGAAGRW